MRLLPPRLTRALHKYGWQWLFGLLMTAAAALNTLGFGSNDAIERMDGYLSGLRMRLEKPVLDPRIVIVDIDEKSLSAVGRFPWSRDIQASLINQLTEHYKVGAVGFDISFPEADNSSGYSVLEQLSRQELKDVPGLKEKLAELKPEMDYDGLFAAAMQGQPVVLGFNVSEKEAKGVLPKPAFDVASLNGRELTAQVSSGYEANIARLQKAAAGAGIFTAMTDDDGVIRRTALLQRIGEGYYPTLSLATAAVFLKARAIAPDFHTNIAEMSANEREAGGVDNLLMFTPNKKIPIPVGYGLTTIVEFRGKGGPEGGAFRYISAIDVLTAAAPPAQLANAVVLIGTTAPGLKDIRVTPVDKEYPGVEVHANVIKSILDGRFKARPDVGFVLEFFQVLVVGLALSWALAVLSPLRSIALTALAMAAAGGFNYYMYYRLDAVLDLALLLLLIFSLFLFNVAWGYFFVVRKSGAMISLFGEYVDPDLVAEMAENPEQYNMDGESCELSVMFVDVRGFTTISEGLSPKALREYINLYLTAMSEDIRSAHQGTLDKYIGDAVMAFWGAPVHFADHASRAVATALLMQASAARLNTAFLARDWPALKIGIGVNSGLMHVGDMGSKVRRAYTVMGDAVNLASRLEGITKVYGVGIAVGETTRTAAPEFAYRELDRVRVKGKNEPVAIFEPLGLLADQDGHARTALASWHTALAWVRAQDWDGAEALLHKLHADSPDCGLYSLYLERIAYFRKHPPGEQWDGVTTFDTK